MLQGTAEGAWLTPSDYLRRGIIDKQNQQRQQQQQGYASKLGASFQTER